MKRIFFFILSVVLIIGAVISCEIKKSPAPVIIENTKEITHTVKDTVYQIEADSSYYEAYIDCVNGKPVLRETPETINNSKPGKTLSTPKTIIAGNKLTVQCKKQAQELFKQWRETYIKEHEQKPIYVDNPIYKDKPLSWLQSAQIWLGRIFLLGLAIVALAFVLRWKKII